jgi:proline iminopeptidase
MKAFGERKDKPIIFLHGGPGYNSANFEATTAPELSKRGFFVIVYDRRGEGRSKDPSETFTFQQTFEDLKTIYQQYGLKRSTLIGHSFGGIVATLFAESYPEKVQSVILVSAPVSMQASFRHILAQSKVIYESRKDSMNLRYLSLLEQMDTTSFEYMTYCLAHAMQNRFYSPKNPTDAAKSIYANFKTDTLLKKYASQMSYQAPKGFWKNEKYTGMNITQHIEAIQRKGIKVYGLYGKEDGLYSLQQIAGLQHQIGRSNLKYLDDCSHNVFIDQQAIFLETVKTWIK